MLSRLSLAIAGLWTASVAAAAPLTVVPSVDLSRYAGQWFEIARFPNRFQSGCASRVTATYTLRPDGRIEVLNQCQKPGGGKKDAKGIAWVAERGGPNTKLKVRFFWPFSGDYWIVGLDPQYRWALVGEPSRKYLWILSREPRLEEGVYQQIVQLAQREGFDTARLVKTVQ